MFESKQDTGLLQGALLTAFNDMNKLENAESANISNLMDVKRKVDIVSSSITNVIQKFLDPKGDDLNKQNYHHKRLHSAIFFKVLRSNGIQCEEADTYYESILHNFPEISWEFYVRLNFYCDWSAYFIKAAQQLQPEIVEIIIKTIINIKCTEEVDLITFTWHLALQVLIHKFFQLDDTRIIHNVQECVFSFPFKKSSADTSGGNRTAPPADTSGENTTAAPADNEKNLKRSKLLHTFVTVLNRVMHADKNMFKLVLHAYKTIFQLLLQTTTSSLDLVLELFRLNPVFQDYCHRRSISLPDRHRKFSNVCYSNISWSVCDGYMVFLLLPYWRNVLRRCKVDESFEVVPSMLPSSDLLGILEEINPFYSSSEIFDQHVPLIESMLRYHYPGVTDAASVVLTRTSLLKSENFLTLLENNETILISRDNYMLLAEAVVVAAENKDTKVYRRLLKLFFKVMSLLPISAYDSVLQWTLEHSCYEYFECEEFETNLNLFMRKTLSYEEALLVLPPLFLQNTDRMLNSVLEQALMQGEEGMNLIKVLKFLPSVCSDKDHLVYMLKNYFKMEELSLLNEKNVLLLVETLLNIQRRKNILPLDLFLEHCIFPDLLPDCLVVETALKCLTLSFTILCDQAIESNHFETLVSLIFDILDYCIAFGHGALKELTLNALNFIELYQERTTILSDELKISIWERLPDSNLFMHIYFFNLLETSESKDDLLSKVTNQSRLLRLQLIWTLKIKSGRLFTNEDPSLQELTYLQLINVLVPLFIHYTRIEWQESAKLLQTMELYLLQPLRGTPRGDSMWYPTVRCLTDCYHFLMKQDDVYDINYLSSNFTNTLMNLLESDPLALVCVFIDACHLSTLTNPDLLSSFLLFVRHKLANNFDRLLAHCVKQLPESETKDKLLKTL